MPGNNPSPIFALFAELDLRDFSGLELFYRQGAANTTSFPSFDTAAGEGRYEDWLDVLNGRGSQTPRTLQAEATAAKTFPSTITVGLDAEDRVYIEGARHSFTVYGHGVSNFGFSTAGDAPDGGGPPYRTTASGEWVRGLCEASATIGIVPSTGGYARFSIPPTRQYFQAVPTKLRALGAENDADDPANVETVLEYRDNSENDAVNRNFRWWIDDSGHVGWSCRSSVAASASSVTWVNTSFRDLLGFSGNETVASDGLGANYQVADYPAQAAIVPSRPVETLTREADHVDAAVGLVNGRIVGNDAGTYERLALSFWMDGPADATDLHRHWIDRVVPYMSRGRRVSFYGEWGDPRRGLLGFDVTAEQPAYDLLYTSEKDGERGRFRGRVSLDSGSRVSVSWPGSLRRRAPASLTLRKAED